MKRAVEGHGGRVWVESQSGQGATFYVMLRGEADASHEEVLRPVFEDSRAAS